MDREKLDKSWTWENEEWTVPQLAAYLEVSPTFVRNKIIQKEIHVTKGGLLPLEAGDGTEWEHYKISKDEVKRILRELPLPATGETFEQRLRRGCERFYRIMGLHEEKTIERFLNLEEREDDQRILQFLLFFARHRPRTNVRKSR